MQGDFSRDTFERLRHFSRVLRQQGRVELDADTNEQTSILLHLIRSLARDVYGRGWGAGFEITAESTSGKVTNIGVSVGNYYVDGILCENDSRSECGNDAAPPPTKYTSQELKIPDTGLFLVYLEVWEEHINWIEEPGIREVALGGPDTASRSRVIWRVRVATSDDFGSDLAAYSEAGWKAFLEKLWPTNRGCLIVTLTKPKGFDPAPCPTSPTSRYRGAENQLYRVQIHRGGTLGDDPGPTFIWSRDNGCLVYAIRQLEPDTDSNLARVSLESLGRDAGQRLEANQWVELVDGSDGPARLFRIANVYPEDLSVDLGIPKNDVFEIKDATTRAFLRRWDHKAGPDEKYEGAIPVVEGTPITIENGIEITFQAEGATYEPGDYWLIPARTATGDIEWPRKNDNPDAPIFQPPRGEEHHFAPLAVIDPSLPAPSRSAELRRIV